MGKDAKTLLLLATDHSVQDMVEAIVIENELAMHKAFDLEDARRLLSKGGSIGFAFDLDCLPGAPTEAVKRLKQEFPEIPLLAFYRPFERNQAIDLLQAGAYACLELPFNPEELAYNLCKIVANNMEAYNPFMLRYEERVVVMPNDFSLVTQVAKNLVDTTLPPNEKRRYHIILGLSEIMNNAIEHGNLGISFEEKSQALKSSQFFPLAIERANKEPYKSRVVTVRSRVYPAHRRIEFLVADQGAGFDWRSLPDPKDKENLLNRHGRGIMIARYAFDEIVYNDVGNQVSLVVVLENPYKGMKI